MSLTLEALAAANAARMPHFRNSQGGPAHSSPDGSDWSLLEWAGSLAGEVGELSNLLKKVRRGDMTLDEARVAIGKELADVQCYLSILAWRAGVNLGDATISKFNEVSARIGYAGRLDADTGEFFDPTATLMLPLGCARCYPGKPGRELIDCDGSAGFRACTGCSAHAA